MKYSTIMMLTEIKSLITVNFPLYSLVTHQALPDKTQQLNKIPALLIVETETMEWNKSLKNSETDLNQEEELEFLA
jgi:conjugal transfer/entry exclusion protein